GGVAVAFFTLPKAISFLVSMGGSGIAVFFQADRYLRFVLFMGLAFGLTFEFPLVLVFLSMVGLLSSAAMLRAWRPAAAIINRAPRVVPLPLRRPPHRPLPHRAAPGQAPGPRRHRGAMTLQTFLPYPDFAASAQALDQRRLGKQRVEALQVLRGLTTPGNGWGHHPAGRVGGGAGGGRGGDRGRG